MNEGDNKVLVQEQDDAGWQYKPTPGTPAPSLAPMSGPSAAPNGPSDGIVEWSASEFVAHEKGLGWYTLLGLGAVVVAGGLYAITRDVFSAAVVPIMAVILGIAGSRKPRVVVYSLDNSGLTAGGKHYPYVDYKSFAMPEEGPFASVVLIPMKRFGVPVSAYLAPDTQDEALEVLSSHLPMERGQLDGIDRLMRHLRF